MDSKGLNQGKGTNVPLLRSDLWDYPLQNVTCFPVAGLHQHGGVRQGWAARWIYQLVHVGVGYSDYQTAHILLLVGFKGICGLGGRFFVFFCFCKVMSFCFGFLALSGGSKALSPISVYQVRRMKQRAGSAGPVSCLLSFHSHFDLLSSAGFSLVN